MDELAAGVLADDDDSELSTVFTAQLEAWFQLEYSRESIRVQYQLMVSMGKQDGGGDPNIAPMVASYGRVREEMKVLEGMMLEAFKDSEATDMDSVLAASHYYPSKGIAFSAPEGLKKRLVKGR